MEQNYVTVTLCIRTGNTAICIGADLSLFLSLQVPILTLDPFP